MTAATSLRRDKQPKATVVPITASVRAREKQPKVVARQRRVAQPTPGTPTPTKRQRPGTQRPAARKRPLKKAGATARAAQPARKATAPRAKVVASPTLTQRLMAPVGFLIAAGAIAAGWHFRDSNPLSAEQGLGYALGIVSVCCVLTLLMYPLRKRLKFLRFIGPTRIWFRTHQQMGVTATVAGLYHCNFQVGSLNSQLALVSLLLIAGSGLIGRFLYRKIHRTLYGRKTDLNAIRTALAADAFPDNRALRFLPLLKQRIHRFDEDVLASGSGLLTSITTSATLAGRARRERRILSHFSATQLAKEAGQSKLIAQHHKRLHWAIDRYLYAHMARLRMLARVQAYERLFALWHVVHLPFFVLLVLSVSLHIFAVHQY